MDCLLSCRHSSWQFGLWLGILWVFSPLHWIWTFAKKVITCIDQNCLAFGSPKRMNQSRGQTFCLRHCKHEGCTQSLCRCQDIHLPPCRWNFVFALVLVVGISEEKYGWKVSFLKAQKSSAFFFYFILFVCVFSCDSDLSFLFLLTCEKRVTTRTNKQTKKKRKRKEMEHSAQLLVCFFCWRTE